MGRPLTDNWLLDHGWTALCATWEADAEDRISGLWDEDDGRDMGPEPVHPDTEVY